MDKIIRVKLPAKINQPENMEEVTDEILSELLIAKLHEEVQEVVEAIKSGVIIDISEEIGDVEAVLDAMLQHHNIDFIEHIDAADHKTYVRGGFLTETGTGIYWNNKENK